MCVYAVTNSGAGACLYVKRSIIEGVAFEKEDADRIANIINSLVEYNQSNVVAHNAN